MRTGLCGHHSLTRSPRTGVHVMVPNTHTDKEIKAQKVPIICPKSQNEQVIEIKGEFNWCKSGMNALPHEVISFLCGWAPRT